MKNWWLKLGCFVTGYNYEIVRNSSEATAKTVKKYLSAILIVAMVWAFIGFTFTQRYLHGGLTASIIGAIVMVIIIIQIERQIILSYGKKYIAIIFRVAIALVMAVIGSVILDQVIFKEDVEKQKIHDIQVAVNEIMPVKTSELYAQIDRLNENIRLKETERAGVIDEVTRRPTISTPTTEVIYERDSVTTRMVPVGRKVITSSIPNPKTELIAKIDEQLQALMNQKNEKELAVLNVQQDLELELKSKIGFLDELKTLFSILTSSWIPMTVWAFLFAFFLMIELFVVVSKFGDHTTDYDKIVLHQMNVRIKTLDSL